MRPDDRAIRERLAQLQESVAALATEVGRLGAHAASPTQENGQLEVGRQSELPTRRAALTRLGTAAALGASAIAATEMLRPEPAAASAGTMTYGTNMDAGGDETSLTSTNTNWTLQTGNTTQPAAGTHAAGLFGASAYGIGVVGVQGPIDAPDTTLTPAILGRSDTSPGVMGLSNSSSGVIGETTNTTSETYGVHGRTFGSLGRAMFGWSLATSGGTGVWGQSNNGSGVGVRGYAWDNGTGQFGTGVMGTSGSTAFPPPPPVSDTGVFGVSVSPSGGASPAGVVGDSNTNAGVAGFASAASRGGGEFTHTAGGRAGIFGLASSSGKAQIRLKPSSASTHPASGSKGDLFADSSGRLWFCKGSTTWKQLA